MANPKPADVDAYLAAQPPNVRRALVGVRAAMRRALPAAEEVIKYGMPAYLIGGRAIASFAGWKSHYALYFVSTALFDAIAEELPDREAKKGIIRFELEEPVPGSVVRKLASFGAEQGAAAKEPKPAKRPAARAKKRKPKAR